MAVDPRIARSFSAFRRVVLKVATSLNELNEVDVYARRLQSYDRLTKKELALYVTRRRQALLFFATQTDPVLVAWKTAHPDEARFCSEEGWATIPTGELTTSGPTQLTVAQRANAARVLGWWSTNEQLGRASRRIKHVGQPSDLRKLRLQDTPTEIACLSLDEGRILAAPCSEAGEYHFLSDVFFIESRVSGHSEREEQYLTDLDARTELLVRKRLPMNVAFKTEPCVCGRPFPILEVED